MRPIVRSNVLVLAVVSALGAVLGSCGGGEGETVTTGGGQSGTGGSEVHVAGHGPLPALGATPASAVTRCGAQDSYFYVSTKFKCPGGGNPLGGNVDAAGQARRGNIGPGPDGHIVDVYDVQCPSGSVAVYVDMYHCRPGQELE